MPMLAPPRKERLMKATVLALTALWAGALIAQTPAPPPQHAAHLEKLATLLDLTDAQKTQVPAILQKLTPVLSPAQLKKFQTLQEMHGEMRHHFGHGAPPGSPSTPPPAQN